MTPAKTCAREGCTAPVTSRHGNARYCSDACKSSAWREKTGYALQGIQKACQTRKKTSGPSGPALSWAKTVRALAGELQRIGYDAEDAEAEAVRILLPALPDKQRARLEARDAR
jgi:hypothetical protein